MPIYEYVCEKCGNRVEVLQRLSDAAPEACPNDAGRLTRVLSAHNVGGDRGWDSGAPVSSPGMSCGTCGKPGPGCS